jgi:Ca2+-binding RTX toxin-like protein
MNGRRRLRGMLGAGALCLLGTMSVIPAHAGGDESCTFENNKVKVRLLDDGSSAAVTVALGKITMNGNPKSCGAATVLNTDEINVRDTSNGGSTGFIIDLSGGQFSDGGTEIPFEIDLRTGTRDAFGVFGSVGNDFMTLGQDGANLQEDGEAEVSFQSSPDIGLIAAQDGVDRVCAGGAHGTGGRSFLVWAITGGRGADRLCGGGVTDFLSGSGGSDQIGGGPGGDVLRGKAGNDRLAGKSGNDRLFGNMGDDVLIGGRGIDICRGGEGSDQITSC